jgi:hypothetical protein
MPDFSDTSDVLNLSTALRATSAHRAQFDPTNPAHTTSLAKFIETGNWGAVQFYCEHPFTDVPMTVLMKYAGFALGVKRLTSAERAARLIEAAEQ